MANVDLTLSDTDIDRLAAAVAVKLRPDLAKVAAANGNGKDSRLLWTEAETAERLAVSKHTLKTWRLEGLIACFSSRPVRYNQESIDAAMAWLRTREEPKK